MPLKKANFLMITIITIITITIIVIMVKYNEKYQNPSDTDIRIINFNCSAKPNIKLDLPAPDVQCTSGDNPICLDHFLYSSTSQYIL